MAPLHWLPCCCPPERTVQQAQPVQEPAQRLVHAPRARAFDAHILVQRAAVDVDSLFYHPHPAAEGVCETGLGSAGQSPRGVGRALLLPAARKNANHGLGGQRWAGKLVFWLASRVLAVPRFCQGCAAGPKGPPLPVAEGPHHQQHPLLCENVVHGQRGGEEWAGAR